jgi:nucleoside-diphosphate-sugar epimerase
MNHLILGAGPVGLAAATALATRGASVTLVSRRVPRQLPQAVRHQALDVLDPSALRAAAAGAGVVYQCLNAPYHRWGSLFPPLQAAAVGAAQAVGARLVSFENLYAYGQPGPLPFAETSPHRPCSEKGRVRAAMIDELRRLSGRGELQVDHVRASDLFGPGLRESALGDEVLGRVASGKDPRILGNPDLPHTFTFTGDAGETLARVGLLEGASSGRVWHVPSAPPVSQRQVIEKLGALLGRKLTLVPTPRAVLYLVGLLRPAARALVEMLYEFEQPFTMADAAAREVLGQAHTPFDSALERTLAAFTASPT